MKCQLIYIHKYVSIYILVSLEYNICIHIPYLCHSNPRVSELGFTLINRKIIDSFTFLLMKDWACISFFKGVRFYSKGKLQWDGYGIYTAFRIQHHPGQGEGRSLFFGAVFDDDTMQILQLTRTLWQRQCAKPPMLLFDRFRSKQKLAR